MNVERARAILVAKTNRDALSLSQLGPLQKEVIVDSFRTQMLLVHPDKCSSDDIAPADKPLLDQATQRLMEARDALLSLLPANNDNAEHAACNHVEYVYRTPETNHAQQPSPPVFSFPVHGDGFGHAYCSRFGCLRALQTQSERESGVCSYCKSQPQKCQYFGCLEKTTDGYCARHKALH